MNALVRIQTEIAEMQAGTRSDFSARIIWQAARGAWDNTEFMESVERLDGATDLDPAWEPNPDDEQPTRIQRLISRALLLEIVVEALADETDPLEQRSTEREYQRWLDPLDIAPLALDGLVAEAERTRGGWDR